ncbi:hypothetical protein PMAL9190_01985 [Photobacterium malacitanum]|uniref:O-Antigen ligase n=1 Tax=Photobacterium malacitanum TaxID=2204294 RepID=A0A1Y6MGE4_9GAMM|nr:hypothetical protein [Photobacterium malacitanum]SMY35616.1 hypothetical protein PMAL9190_01985 [Photobacterium malacitanum]
MKKQVVILYCQILIIMTFPSLFMGMFSLSSLYVGMIFSSFLLLMFNVRFLLYIRITLKSVILLCLLLLYVFIQSSYIYIYHDVFKPIFSLLSFVLMLISIFALSKRISRLSQDDLKKVIILLFYTFLFLGYFSLLNINIGPYTFMEKPVFPFKEQSHFALIIGPFLITYTYISSNKKVLFSIIATSLLALLFPNLTLLLFCSISLFVYFFKNISGIKTLLYFLCGLIIISIFLNAIFNIEYFSSRLSMSNENLTTLVFIQGWEFITYYLLKTNFLGVGFQSLGESYLDVPEISYLISKIYGDFFNISDGGFLASKTISELGLVGICYSISYLFFIFKLILNGFRYKGNESIGAIIIFSFLVEMFFRGYGYFSPMLFLVLSFYFIEYLDDKKHCHYK